MSPKVLNSGVLWTKFKNSKFDFNQKFHQKPTIYMGTMKNMQKEEFYNYGSTLIPGVRIFHPRILALKNVKPQVLGWSHGLNVFFWHKSHYLNIYF